MQKIRISPIKTIANHVSTWCIAGNNQFVIVSAEKK